MLNPTSPLPLYRQLADQLLASIRAGSPAVGERIPGEHTLAARFGVGRPTVRQATEVLVRRGVLRRQRGSGTYVQQMPQEVDVFSLAGTLAAFEGRSDEVIHTLLKPAHLARVPAEASGNPFAGRQAWRFQRLTSMHGAAVLLEDFYLDPDVFPGFAQHDLHGRSLSELVLEEYYLQPSAGRQQFSVHTARVAHLSDDHSPTLLVCRSLDFLSAAGAVYVLMYCRTDRCTFTTTFAGQAVTDSLPQPLHPTPLHQENIEP